MPSTLGGGRSPGSAGSTYQRRETDRDNFTGSVNPFRGKDIARKTKLLYRYLPRGEFSTNDVAAMANGPEADDSDLLESALGAQKLARAQRYVQRSNQLRRSYDGDAVAMKLAGEWDKLTKSERGYLRKLGMEDPVVAQHRDKGGGFWDEITDLPGTILGGVDAVAEGVGEGVLAVGSEGLKRLDQVSRLPTRGWRAGTILAERGLNELTTGSTGRYNADYLNEQEGRGAWAEIAAAWEDSGAYGGEGAYLDATRRDAFKEAGEDRETYGMAYYQSVGMDRASAAQTLASKLLDVDDDDPALKDNPEWVSTMTRLYELGDAKRTKKALNVLSEGHMSPGRMFADAMQIPESGATSKLHTMFSGSVDAAFLIFTDPTLVVGKVVKTARGAKLALDLGADSMGLAAKTRNGLTEYLGEKITVPITDAAYRPTLMKAGLNPHERFLAVAQHTFQGPVDELPARLAAARDLLPKGQAKALSYLAAEDRRLRVLGPRLKDLAEPGVKDADSLLTYANKLDEATDAVEAQVITAAKANADEAISPQQAYDRAYAQAVSHPGLEDTDRLLDYFESVRGRTAMAHGMWDSKRFAQAQMPAITRANNVRNRVAVKAATKISDWRQVDSISDMMDDLAEFKHLAPLDQARYGTEEAYTASKSRTKKLVGNMLHRLGQRSFGGYTHIMDPKAVEEFDHFLKAGINRADAGEMWGRFLAAPNAAQRRQVAVGAMDAQLRALGIHEMDFDLYESYIHRVGVRNQSYSLLDGLDVMGQGQANQRVAGIMTSQVADDVLAMPNFAEMYHAMKRAKVTAHIEGAVNSEFLSAAMSKGWKPWMILRIGFLPRVMVDELLPWMIRDGVGAPFKQWATTPFHNMDETQVPALLKPLAIMERSLRNPEWWDDWKQTYNEALDRVAAGATTIKFGELLSQRGVKRFNMLEQQFVRQGDLTDRSLDIFAALPDQKWATRFAAFNPAEIASTKRMQAQIAEWTEKAWIPRINPETGKIETRALWTDADQRALMAMHYDSRIMHAKLQEVTTTRAAWMSQNPSAMNRDRLAVPVVRSKDDFIIIGQKPVPTQYEVVNQSSPMYAQGVDNWAHQYTTSQEMRPVFHAEAGTPGAADRLTWQPYGWDITGIDDAGASLNVVRDAFTSMTQGRKDDVIRALDMAKSDQYATFARLLNDKGVPDEVKKVIELVLRDDVVVPDNVIAAALWDKTEALRDVQFDDAIMQSDLAQQLGGEPTEILSTRIGREDFKIEMANLEAKLWRHNMPEGRALTEKMLPEEYDRVMARLDELQGKSAGVWHAALENEIDDEFLEVVTRGAAERVARRIDESQADLVARIRAKFGGDDAPVGRAAAVSDDDAAQMASMEADAALDRNVERIHEEGVGGPELEPQAMYEDEFGLKHPMSAEPDQWVRPEQRAGAATPQPESMAYEDAQGLLAEHGFDPGPMSREAAPGPNLADEINELIDNIRFGEVPGTPVVLDDGVRIGAISSDRDVLMDQYQRIDHYISEMSSRGQRHGIPTMAEQGDLARIGNVLKDYEDGLRRLQNPSRAVRPDDPYLHDFLYDAHRMLQTGVVDERRIVTGAVDEPSMAKGYAERQADIEAMAYGDTEAMKRVAGGGYKYEMNRPHNATARKKLDRNIELPDGRQVADQAIDGHVWVYAPMLTPEETQRAVRTLYESATGQHDPLLAGFIKYHRERDKTWSIEQYLDSPVQPGLPRGFGQWASTDADRAQQVAGDLRKAAGIDDPGHYGVGRHQLNERLATDWSPSGMPDDELLLSNTTIERLQAFDPSDTVTEAIALADMEKRAIAEAEYFIRNGGEVNAALAMGIARGRVTPWHSRHAADQARLPDTLTKPTEMLEHQGMWQRAVNYGFEKGIGQWVDGILRMPMYQHNLSRVIRETEQMLLPALRQAGGADSLEYQAMAVLRRYAPDKPPKDAFYEIQSMYGSLKGTYAAPGTNIVDPIERMIAHGAEPKITMGLLKYADENGHMVGPLGDFYARASHELATLDGLKLTKAQERIERELRMIDDWFTKEKEIFGIVNEHAAQRALDNTLPWVDDHRVRSQFAEIGRNLWPFFWAQEQTTRRWLGSIAIDPSAIRKMQLGMNGLRSMGVVRQDQYGDDIFAIPGSQAMQEVMGRVPLFADQMKGAVTLPMTGKVAYAVPFLQDMGTPSTGPVVTVPMRLLAEINPELAMFRDVVVPEGTEDMAWYNDLMPAVVSRTLHAISASPEADRDFASAQMQMIQLMESNHLELTEDVEAAEDKVNRLTEAGAGREALAQAQAEYEAALKERNKSGVPGPGATDVELDTFIERLGAQTRVLLATKAFLGFVSPTAPRPDTSSPLRDEYVALLQTMPVEEAFAAFIKEHPEATPWTVFNTRTPSGAYIESTSATEGWLTENEAQIARYPMAAPWLAPVGNPDPNWQKVYDQQLAQGIRIREMPEDSYREMKFKEASGNYFQMQEDFQMAAASATGAEKRALEDEWAEWRDSYLATHSVFATALRSPRGQQRRQAVMAQMADYVADPRTEVSDRVDKARELVTAQREFEAQMTRLDGDTSGDAQREKLRIRNQYQAWGFRFTRDNPDFSSLWRGVYEQELDPRDLVMDNIRNGREPIRYDTPRDKAKRARTWDTKVRYD